MLFVLLQKIMTGIKSTQWAPCDAALYQCHECTCSSSRTSPRNPSSVSYISIASLLKSVKEVSEPPSQLQWFTALQNTVWLPFSNTNLIQKSSTKVNWQVQVWVGIVDNVSIWWPHNFTDSLPILIKHHNRGTTLICSYVVLVAIQLRKNKVSTVIIHQRHQLPITWTVYLAHLN